MNFEHFFLFFKNNTDAFIKIKDKLILHKISNFMRNYYYLLDLKLKKLKLGAVVFEIKYFFFSNVLLYDWIEMRYVRQDLTEENEMNLETRLNALKWKWDFSNVGAFLIIFFIFIFIFKFFFIFFIKFFFYSFFEDEIFNEIYSFSIKNSLKLNLFSDFLILFKNFYWYFNEIFLENILLFYFKFFT